MDPIVRAWRDGGGRVDLGHPEVRLFLAEAPEGPIVAEEVHPVDRSAFSARRMPRLPFRRPVSLPPKLGRVAVNLAAVRPGDRVADPFLGTGALALEAGILGARVTGVDQDESMVKGALQNFAHLGLQFEGLRVGDAEREASNVEGPFDALVTDPPYGRSSGSGGEAPTTLVARVLPAWAERVRPDGRIVVVLPGGPDPLGPPWRRAESVADRVHRSLTREFRVYARGPPQ